MGVQAPLRAVMVLRAPHVVVGGVGVGGAREGGKIKGPQSFFAD